MTTGTPADAVVVGGGFYGTAIAIYLAKRRGMTRVVLLEKENRLLSRASFNNQARVHNGYHYPRSFMTAYRSRINYPRFLADWPSASKSDFTQIYAVAKNNSKVTAHQFERFCREIGARYSPAPPSMKSLFEPRLIEQAYVVEESAFDASSLAATAAEEIREAGIEVAFSACARSVEKTTSGKIRVLADGYTIDTRCVFNCTYSGIGQIAGDAPALRAGLKQEMAEMALIEMPEQLKPLGITVVDGPFFSMMPFPAKGLHTLSHVRYTPHFHWTDRLGVDPYARHAAYDKETRVDRMIRDAARYVPSMRQARYVSSLFEIKTVLQRSEGDDGRPILFENNAILPNYYSILGGKIDNIYDVLEKLDMENFDVQ